MNKRHHTLFNFITAKAIPREGKATSANKQDKSWQFLGFRNHRQWAVSFQTTLTAFTKTAEVNKIVRTYSPTQSKTGRGSRASVASSTTWATGVANPNSGYGPLGSACLCFSLEWAIARLLRCTDGDAWSWDSLYRYFCYVSIALLKPRGSPWVSTWACSRQKN